VVKASTHVQPNHSNDSTARVLVAPSPHASHWRIAVRSEQRQPKRHARENTTGPRQLGGARSRTNQTPKCSLTSRFALSDQPGREQLESQIHVGTKEPPQREASRESARTSDTNSASTSENHDATRDSKPRWLATTLRARLASAPHESMLTRGPVAELRDADHPRDRDHFAGAFAAGKHKALSFGYSPMLMPNRSTPARLQCVECSSPTRHTINPRTQSRELEPVALERITMKFSGGQQPWPATGEERKTAAAAAATVS